MLVTLDQIKNKGLRDHVHGGFFRYTVDPGWTEPHYEKMLYTQALLSQVFIQAADVLDRSDYLEVARDTLAFVSREMRSKKGGYVSSFSAVDSQGNEGVAYWWNQEQLAEVLNGDQLEWVNNHWSMNSSDNAGVGKLPFLRKKTDLDLASPALRDIRLKLRKANRLKNIPIDHKVITAWNALLLSAFSVASDRLNDSAYADVAKQLRDKLVNDFWIDAQLYRTEPTKDDMVKGQLEDYVFMARGLRDYAVLTSSQEDWYLSNLLLAKAWLLFRYKEGWKDAQSNLLPGMQSKTALPDSALPAADAILVYLSLTSDNPVLQEKARHAAGLMFTTVTQTPLEMSSHYWWISFYRNASN